METTTDEIKRHYAQSKKSFKFLEDYFKNNDDKRKIFEHIKKYTDSEISLSILLN